MTSEHLTENLVSNQQNEYTVELLLWGVYSKWYERATLDYYLCFNAWYGLLGRYCSSAFIFTTGDIDRVVCTLLTRAAIAVAGFGHKHVEIAGHLD